MTRTPSSSTLRVLFDAFWWQDGPPSNRMVVQEMVTAWRQTFDDTVLVALPRDTPADDRLDGIDVVEYRAPQHALAAAFDLPRLARRHRADVMIAQNFTPVTGSSAVFIHDVLFQTNPEWFTPLERAYLAAIPHLARRACCVLTSSRSEADRISRNNPLLVPVQPVGLGVKSSLIDVRPTLPAAAGDGPFLLMVGRLNVRKNLATALRAALLSGTVDTDRPVIVVGGPDGRADGWGEDLRRAARSGRIVFTGVVTDAELAGLYQRADAFVFLSRGEGFGLPPVEAQSLGCPVVVSDIPVMREVCHPSAHFVDPTDIAAAASAIADAVAGGRTEPHPPRHTWTEVVTRMRQRLVASPRPRA